MSREGKVTLDWADGTYVFRLGIGELMQLQEATDCGPGWVLARMMQPTAENKGWRVQDITQVIRLGLIGGGLEPAKALRLVREYVEPRPPMENLLIAQAILTASLIGLEDTEDAQKKSAASSPTPSTTSLVANGGSPQ